MCYNESPRGCSTMDTNQTVESDSKTVASVTQRLVIFTFFSNIDKPLKIFNTFFNMTLAVNKHIHYCII